jgi:sigma-B regulation protein RsbU (phosphoserine phosphatase)
MPIHTLRAKITFIIFSFIIIIGMVFFIYAFFAKENYKKLRIENINENVKYETEIVNKIISQIERSAVIYAIGGLLSKEVQTDKFGERFSTEYLLSFPSAIGGGFWFEPYKYKNDQARACFYAFHDKNTGTVKLDDTFNPDEYDYQNKTWYTELKDNIKYPNQTSWTKPYVDDSGSYSLMTTAGAGFFDEEGSLLGLSTVDWGIDEVVKELTSVKPTVNSFILLCVPEKDYIISNTYNKNDTGAAIGSIPWDIASDSFILDGKKYLRFGKYMDNGWFMSVQIPENEIFEEAERNERIFIAVILLSAIIVLFAAYLFISKYINNPIKKLTQEVSKIEIGNLESQINITTKDELGEFAKVINKMTVDLKNSIEENARERKKTERFNVELNVAMNIQTSILPSVFPPFPDRNEFDIYASMHAAKEVGGDLYDFFFIDKNNLAVVIADVSGKGIPAALFMVIAKTLIKNCSLCKSPKMLMESVNKKLCEGNDASIFVTAFVGFYNLPTGRFVYINAGHNPPLLKKKGGKFEYLRTAPCMILAFLKDTKYKEEELYLEKGDLIYMYTDGVTEAMNHKMEMFGEQKLLETVNQFAESTPKEIIYSVKKAIDNFTDEEEQADDITMLALKIGKSDEFENSIMKGNVSELKIEAKTENLRTSIAFVNQELEIYKHEVDLINEIDIAVEEIFINIANYAYYPENGNVLISVSAGEKIKIKFEDTGRPYNPLEQADPNLESSPEKREIGGLGIYLAKKIMDTMEYTRVGNKNILVMTKKFPA